MDLQLRVAASQSDLSAAAKVLDDVFGMSPPATMLRVGFMFDLLRSEQLVLLASDATGVIGTAVRLRGKTHVEGAMLAVLPAHQGAGVGRALFHGTTDWATDNGYDEVRWCVSPQTSAQCRPS
ncbi:MAG: hypothetical protein DLM55_04350 [Acidimicrobiales bacterium]|nr:MAG: hypothetical protein DLM55_04350 [Acidimicrobiales bacterium]